MDTNKRNSSIELLRIIFMLLIMTIHVYAHGSELIYKWIYSLGGNINTAWNLSIFSIGILGVTGFMFISGYYGIHTKKKGVLHILIITFFYALVLGIPFDKLNLGGLISIVFGFDMWWFVSCYVFLMLLAPFIEEGINKLSKRQFQLLLAGMFIYTYLMRFFFKDNSHDIILFLTVYLGARYLWLYPSSPIASTMRRGG